MLKKIALEWNNPVAQYLIGAMYLNGDKSITPHEKQALKWLSLAADNNWAGAMVLLGASYREGKLLKKDDQKALSWFQRVVQKDDNETEPVENGILYLFGNKEFELQLKEPDVISFIKSKVDHHIVSPAHYVNLLDGAFKPVTWSLLTNKKSCGVIPSQVSLGIMYFMGIADTIPDYQKSMYFLKKATKNRNKEACIVIGTTYEYGEKEARGCEEAVRWYKRTLELNGDIEAAYRIGVIYYNAKGVTSDCKLALEYFRLRVSHSDHGPSYVLMAHIYETGDDGVPQDYILAHQYYEKAFNCGEVRGAVSLIKFYMVGLGVRKDCKKVEEWMRKAATIKSRSEQRPQGLLQFFSPLQNIGSVMW